MFNAAGLCVMGYSCDIGFYLSWVGMISAQIFLGG